MKSEFLYLLLCSFTILINSCATQFQQIQNPNVPFERPSYSILPPQGNQWFYADREQTGRYDLDFGKKFDSHTHTLGANLVEIHSVAAFNNPDEFLAFIRKSKEMDTDPKRFHLEKNEIHLSSKFGTYSVVTHMRAEDYAAVNKGDSPFLVLEIYGYTFIHPNDDSTIIDISYSERGKPDEIDPNFEATAQQFIDGLKLKDKSGTQ